MQLKSGNIKVHWEIRDRIEKTWYQKFGFGLYIYRLVKLTWLVYHIKSFFFSFKSPENRIWCPYWIAWSKATEYNDFSLPSSVSSWSI